MFKFKNAIVKATAVGALCCIALQPSIGASAIEECNFTAGEFGSCYSDGIYHTFFGSGYTHYEDALKISSSNYYGFSEYVFTSAVEMSPSLLEGDYIKFIKIDKLPEGMKLYYNFDDTSNADCFFKEKDDGSIEVWTKHKSFGIKADEVVFSLVLINETTEDLTVKFGNREMVVMGSNDYKQQGEVFSDYTYDSYYLYGTESTAEETTYSVEATTTVIQTGIVNAPETAPTKQTTSTSESTTTKQTTSTSIEAITMEQTTTVIEWETTSATTKQVIKDAPVTAPVKPATLDTVSTTTEETTQSVEYSSSMNEGFITYLLQFLLGFFNK